MDKVLIVTTAPVLIGGEHLDAGVLVEVSKGDAATIIAANRGRKATDAEIAAAKPETQE